MIKEPVKAPRKGACNQTVPETGAEKGKKKLTGMRAFRKRPGGGRWATVEEEADLEAELKLWEVQEAERQRAKEYSLRLLRSNNRMTEAAHDAAALILLMSEGLAAAQKYGGAWEDDGFAEFLNCGFSSLGLEYARKLYQSQLDPQTPND
jgi:hypothetical protein